MTGMDLSSYRMLWKTRGVPTLLLGALLARMPVVATMIPLSFMAKDASGGFGWAGVVAGAYSVGTAVGAPYWSRRADRHGARRILIGTGLSWAVAIALLAAMPDAWYRAMPLVALVAGLALPPVSATARALWPRLVAGPRLRTAYALDSVTVELLFAVGPMLGAVMVTFASPRLGLLVIAVWSVIAVWWFADQQLEAVRHPDGESRLTSLQVLRNRTRLAIMGSFLLAVGAFSACSLGIAAFADEQGDRMVAGWLETVWAIGSLLGGLVAGALPGRRPSYVWRRAALISVGLFGCAAAAGWTGSAWVLGIALLTSGCVLAPTIAAMNERLGSITPDTVRTEVFGWMNGAGMLGAALGAVAAGAVIERFGVAAVFVMAGAVVAVATVALVKVPPHRPEPVEDEPTLVGPGTVLDGGVA
jgi:MFS family permease